MQERWGLQAEDLPPDHPAWTLEAHYLALGLANWVCTLSPRCIVLGGGVMQQQRLFEMIREDLARLLNGYVRAKELTENLDQFVIPPGLGTRSGIIGALVLAEQAYQKQQEFTSPLPTRK
jgi:fructokinase